MKEIFIVLNNYFAVKIKRAMCVSGETQGAYKPGLKCNFAGYLWGVG